MLEPTDQTLEAGAGSTSLIATDGQVALVLELLHVNQERRGYIAEEDLRNTAVVTGLSAAELYSAVTAYPRFRLEPGLPASAVCTGPVCLMHGASALKAGLAGAGVTHCLGLCDQPIAILTPEGARTTRDGARLLMPATPPPAIGVTESVFFSPEDPFETVRSALSGRGEDLITAVTESGLQGRGGAGFPAGLKWTAVRGSNVDRKFVVCNADESEPGSFKDRVLLDHQPRRLLAGMVLAGHAVGATEGIIYIRYEYGAQYKRLIEEIARLRAEGLLGNGFDIVVRRGAGAYICGEETALLNSLEGLRPVPRERPPYPVTTGLYGVPTLIHNVETLAAVPAIIAHGPDWYQELGRPKLYCISGDVPSSGVWELPMTVRAHELIERAGTTLEEIKAFTLGGLSGGLLPASHADVRLDFQDPRRYDAYLGSGGVIVLGRSRCSVRFTLEAMRFFAEESCGKCFPCRIGTTRLRERLERITRLLSADIGEMDEIRELLMVGSACGLGPAAALVVKHLLTHFGAEVEVHEQSSRCPSGECMRG